jgi:hypothetical protein
MFKISEDLKRPIIVSLLLCYLTLLGFHHFQQNRSDGAEQTLLADQLRDEIPEELAQIAAPTPKKQPEKKVSTPPELTPAVFKKGTLPSLAPKHLSQDSRFRYYEQQAAKRGQGLRGKTVLGFRGLAPDGSRHSSEDNATNYDDTFVILDPRTKRVTELLGSTHAGQATSTLSPGGVAQIKPGLYRAHPCGEYAGMPCWLVTTPGGNESVPCWRDANGNGFIDSSEQYGELLATEILFHNGRYSDYGSSIGCQVLPPELMETFIREIGETESFDFYLIDANQKFR